MSGGLVVSVIVPVFNSRAFLAECVQSILGQTIRDLELLLVDDGSTDGSGEFCDSLAARDPRIRVFHQANQGQSVARNHALKHATGQYVAFIDSDDWVTSSALEMLVAAAVRYGVDIVHGDFLAPDGRPHVRALDYYQRVMPAEEYIVRGIRSWSYDVVPVLNLVRREALEEHRFMEGVYFEDNEFTYRLYSDTNLTFVRVPVPFYFYRMNPSSTTHTYSEKKARDCICVAERMHGLFAQRTKRAYPAELAVPILVVLGQLAYVYSHLDNATQGGVASEIPAWTREFMLRHSAGRPRFDLQNRLFALSPQGCAALLRLKLRGQGRLR